MLELERGSIIKIIRGIAPFDNIFKEVMTTTNNNQKIIRRRVEDHLRKKCKKCELEDLAIVAALLGIDTVVQTLPGGTNL
jgi:hypothetical protein